MSNEEQDLRAKIDCLSQPETYANRPLVVEVIETHFAWVFLTGKLAYKMKKPHAFRDFDLTALATRRANCELEVALNRRLAPGVYIGTVPLTMIGTRLSLEGPGTPVEWLVKMHRLPRERALDRLAAGGEIDETHLHALLERLARFYADTTRAPWDGRKYRQVLATEIDRTARDLAAPRLGLDAALIAAIAAELASRLEADAPLFHKRIADGRVVDAHGDLRPEHVFLLPEPKIIDCLEFSAELRLLDSAAEIAFLALECERLGHAELGARVLEGYRECAGDDCEAALLEFYRALRAFVRAKVAAWHLEDELSPTEQARWRECARWYLDAAATSLSVGSRSAALEPA